MEFEKLKEVYSKLNAFIDGNQLRGSLNEEFLLSEELINQYESKIDNNKILHLGIVGRIKAGKSSLLNALFFNGKSILPKAVTPMTAALTKITYSESIFLKLVFLTESDIEKFKDQKEKFDANWNDFLNTEESRDKAFQNSVYENLSNQFPGRALYEAYMSSSADVKAYVGQEKTVNLNSIDEISKELLQYVGADGKFTNIINYVELGIPDENLKNIYVVDTPGFDDPLESRDAVARQSLKKCDVIFILSPADKFLDTSDFECISKITKGEGLQELTIIPSQIDTTRPDSGTTILREALEEYDNNAKKRAQSQLKRILDPSIYESQVLTGKIKILHTSGICHSLYLDWDNRNQWGNSEHNILTNLNGLYDEFEDENSETAKYGLKILGNIENIRETLNDVQNRKDSILKKNAEEFLKTKENGAKAIITEITNYLESRIEEIRNGDSEKLAEKLKLQERKQVELEASLKDGFDEVVNDTLNNIKSDILSKLMEAKETAISSIGGLINQKVENWTTGHLWWKQQHSESYNSINTSQAKNTMYTMKDKIYNSFEDIQDIVFMRLKKKLKTIILDQWNKYEIDDDLSQAHRDALVMKIIDKIKQQQFVLNTDFIGNTNFSAGVITRGKADQFIDIIYDSINLTYDTSCNAIRTFISSIKDMLDPTKMASSCMEKTKEEYQLLIEEIKNKELNEKRYENSLSNLKAITSEYFL